MTLRKRLIRCVLFGVLLLVVSGLLYNCHTRVKHTLSGDAQIAARNSLPVQPVLMPVDSLSPIYASLRPEVFNFYRSLAFRPVWSAFGIANVASDSLLSFIKGVRYYGLLPTDYGLAEIEICKERGDSADSILRMEALLTSAFIRISEDLSHGRLTSKRVDSGAQALLYTAVLTGRIRPVLESAEPQYHAYRMLREGLRLILDSLAGAERGAVLAGNGLAASDARYQRIQKVEVNLERWRAERHLPDPRYVMVNIPSFTLRVVSGETVVMESRVIVGRPATPTPVLSSLIECFVTYPYWHVPRSIALEYLPVIQRDTMFIIRNNFELFDSQWKKLDPAKVEWSTFNRNYFPVILRQREGTDNSLGIIKFVFDNPYSVYLHDTNAKRLFERTTRALSHGCVRVEQAAALAHYFVTEDPKERSATLQRYLSEKEKHTIALEKPVPVHIRYYTCEGGAGGSVVYYPDIYKKDPALLESFYRPRPM